MADQFASEDQMTERVFGDTLRHLDTSEINEIFEACGISFEGELTYTLHETFTSGSKEPDVLVDDSVGQTVLIEAKRYRQEPEMQLKKEYEELEDHRDGENYILLLSAHTSRPSYLNELGIEVRWMSWKHIEEGLTKQLAEDRFGTVGESLVTETVGMLRKEGSAHFRGFETSSQEAIDAHQTTLSVYRHFGRLVDDIRDKLTGTDIEFSRLCHYWTRKNQLPDSAWKYSSPALWYSFGLSNNLPENRDDSYLFIGLVRSDGLIRVGYHVRPQMNELYKDSLERHNTEVAELWVEKDFEIMETAGRFTERYRLETESEVEKCIGNIDEFEKKLLRETDADNFKRLLFAKEFDLDDLDNEDAVETIYDALMDFHRLTFVGDDEWGMSNERPNIFYPDYKPDFA